MLLKMYLMPFLEKLDFYLLWDQVLNAVQTKET